MAVVQGVDDEPYAAAVEIIEAARKRQVPAMTKNEAAARAGLSPAGWLKIRRTGRGREENIIALARVVGVEAEVRQALNPMPLDGDSVPPFEASILASGLTPAQQRAIIEIYRSPGGWEWLQSVVHDRVEGMRQA